ncbi:MAG: PilZ domain-containing protein [Desulfobacterales bacterium]
MVDRRKHHRIQTQNLISHFSFDETGKQDSQGIGKALDISRGGMLIETPYPIESGSLSLMAVDLEGNLVEIEGKLAYSKRSHAGTYLSGIAFVGNDAQVINFVIKLVKEYNYRKSNLFIRWHSRKTPINSSITN